MCRVHPADPRLGWWHRSPSAFKVSRGVHPISACALRNRPLVAGGWLLFVAHALWNHYSRLKGTVT
ncbi:MAG TPA: hypothetical protein DCR70_09190 [Phycisphaerales bacterium]|nr:hypothetical protein [Phycisphaerales bacterium]